jgi:arylsulfatase A-like enzyme
MVIRWVGLAPLAAVTSVIAGSLLAGPSGVAEGQGPDKRNVLVIVTDDQRLDTMEMMPSTQRFFSGGARYRAAYATTPQCCPSRASMLSGKYSHNHGVEANSEAADFDPDESWPHLLDQAGYRTAYFGKYLNGWNPAVPVPDFDESFVGYDRAHSPSAENSSEFVTKRAQRFIRVASGTNKPWAVQLALRAPHAPRIFPDEYRDLVVPGWKPNPATDESDFSDKNPALAAAQKPGYPHEDLREDQLKMLAAADDALDHLYRMLKQTGELDDTLVIFTSDNGYYWGEHQLTGKALPYLDSMRVPMLVRGPGIDAGRSRELVANIDIAPTILDFANMDAPFPLDGVSLFSRRERNWLLLEGAKTAAGDNTPPWEHGYLSGKTHYFEWSDSSEEYYDLQSDPFELESELAEPSPPENLATIRARVDRAAQCAGADCP